MSGRGQFLLIRRSFLVAGLLICATSLLVSEQANAQAAELARQNQTRERTLRQLDQLERQERLLQMENFEIPLIDMGQIETNIPADGEGPKILLNKVDINDSKILSDQELSDIIDKYVGEELYIADLYKMIGEINTLYRNKKFITARAVLPPQTMKDGILKIQLIEGRVGTLRIEGNDYTSANFISKRIGLQAGDLVELGALEISLIRFNKLHKVQLGVQLMAGSSFEETDLVITAKEPDRYSLTGYFDRHGTESTGEHRLGMIFGSSSLFGFEDALSMGMTRSQNDTQDMGSRSGFINYAPYINSHDTQLELNATRSNSTIIGGSFANLNIHGLSKQYGATLSHPVLVDQANVLKLDMAGNYSNSSSEFTGILEETRIEKMSAGSKWERLGEGSYLTLDFHGHYMWANVKGTSGWDKAKYRKVTASGFWLQGLNEDLNFQLTGNAQYVPMERSIVSAEQFLLGGQYSVRAYEESQFSGNDGYYLGFELQSPFSIDSGNFDTWKDRQASGNFYAFFDHGGAFPERSDTQNSRQRQDYANAIGVGVRANRVLGAMNMDLFVAKGLDNVHKEKIKNPRIQFSVGMTF